MVTLRLLPVLATAFALLALAGGPRASAAEGATPAPAAAAAPDDAPIEIPGARLWLEIERPEGRDPRVQEMVIVRVHGSFIVPVALYELEPPALDGFRWLAVGRDVWGETVDRGRQMRGFLATFALFPQQSGRLEIGRFVDHLTIVGSDGKRQKVDIATAPATLEVAAAAAPPGEWWLPARDLTVTESWSVDPRGLAIGQSTRRTITISATGVTDDQLPPPPSFASPKLIAFADPPERSTVMGVAARTEIGERKRQSLPKPGRLAEVAGRDGPVASVTYAWTVRPTTDEAVTVPAIEIPWFDTDRGEAARALVPARTVSVSVLGHSAADLERALGIAAAVPAAEGGAVADLALPLAFLAGFGATAAALWGLAGIGLPGRIRARLARRRALAAMSAAAGRGDAAAVWAGLERLRDADAVLAAGAASPAAGRGAVAAAARHQEGPALPVVAALFSGPSADPDALRDAVAGLRRRTAGPAGG